MAIFCIPRPFVDKLKQSFANPKEINLQKLYDMSSKERHDFFVGKTNQELGTFLNTKLEQAMVSKQKTALTDWVNSVFDPKARAKPVYKTIVDKINSLDELGILNPKSQKAFLEDLVSDKLGVNVSPEEVAKLSDLAKGVQAAQEKLGADLGHPDKLAENLQFFQAKKAVDDYLLSLNPASNLKIATSTIGRGMMLLSPKSPLLNVGSNFEIGLTEALARRLANLQIRGADAKLAVDYVKMVNKIYQKTGYDISRMVTLADTGGRGSRVLGEIVHSQGPGAVRRTGRAVEDVVFKQLMGAPDVAFSSAHFADSVSLNAAKIFGRTAKATEAMKDAMRLVPQTGEGTLLREQAILDAQTATWTNKTWAADLSQGIRSILNKMSGDLRAGDYLLPFIKTPSNVIATGLDYAGGGFIKALVKTAQMFRAGEVGDKRRMIEIMQGLSRAGIGLTGAVVVTSQLKDTDFVGAYDPARYQIEQLRNSNYNAIRVGGKWISTDWLGPLAVPVTAIMYARKYGKTMPERNFQYVRGAGSAISQIPGIEVMANLVREATSGKYQTVEEATQGTINYALEEGSARLIPSGISDIARATDTKQRVSKKGLEGVMGKIPGLRQQLPAKKNIFGQEMEAESGWSTILFGQRVKTDRETPLIAEINRVSNDTGKGITFTDWEKSNSKTLNQFKTKVGDAKFQKAKDLYGKYMREDLAKLVKSAEYKRGSDEEKYSMITNADTKAQSKVFERYGFKYKPEKKK